ncbi:MAG: ABC transporter ATP-binding protein [Planctomycetota bacterium]
MMPIAAVKELGKRYGPVRAVDDVSFTVAPGEAVALLGPNGSGKTTILRCVAGLLRPDTGTVQVGGMDIRRHYRKARLRFSYLPQVASFPASVTMKEVIEFHAKLRGVGGDRPREALREAGISEEWENRVVGKLSGGMRQRLALAVAGMPPVSLMLLDEPTQNLDPEAALRLREVAGRWRREGRSLLFSTHVLTDVEELADRVVVMVGGKSLVQERVASLRADLRQFAQLRVDVGKPTQLHLDAALNCGATTARLNSHSIIITAPVERRHEILQGLGELGRINHFETDDPSIEQIYMKYVKEGRFDES